MAATRHRIQSSAGARPPPNGVTVSAARRRRFAFLEEELFWKGEVGREVLSHTFDLTPNHVTDDLATYKETCPTNLVYDERRRRYRPGPRFRPRFATADPQRYLAELRAHAEGALSLTGGIAPVEIVSDPSGQVDVALLQAITRAIHAGAGLRITYQSLRTAEPTRRVIFPHALAHNGRRWFTRAFDDLRNEFRDFALARVLRVAQDAAQPPALEDEDWEVRLTLRVRPNPALHPFQRDIVAKEYGMRRDGDSWLWELETRRAMAVYVLDTHRLRPQEPMQLPAQTPLILENYGAVRDADWARDREAI